VLQHESDAALLQQDGHIEVDEVARHANAWRQHVQERGGRSGKTRETSRSCQLQHEHGTVRQRWLPLDQHTDIQRREKRWPCKHEMHAESIAAHRTYLHFANRARPRQFRCDDLIQQTIGQPDRRLTFCSGDIREADALLLSDQLEHSLSIHAIDGTAVLYGVPNPLNTFAVAVRKTILLVEDDQDLRRMFRTSLLLDGYDVLEAGTGLEALTRIDREPPDLVVLDLMLPTVSGVAVREEIAAHVLTREIPVIIVTGTAMNVDHLNVECVLRKPIGPEALVAAVKRCLQRGVPGSRH